MPGLHEHIVVSSKESSVLSAEHKLKSVLDKLDLEGSQEHNLLVAASEAMNNAAVHGNKNDPLKKVVLDIDYNDHKITLEVQDEGGGFNPKDLHIMKSLMDSVSFDFTSKGTKIILQMKVGKNKS
jgi:serine/threonine-protein kinase RsbW